MTKLVSIIIPHFNRTELLKKTIESVEAQTNPGWEIIIVDDQSEIEEWERLQQFVSGKIKVFQREQGEKGPSSCRNFGAKHAKGDYLIFLDSDDLLAPFCVEQRVAVMNANPEMDACVFLMQEFEQNPGDSNRIFNVQIEEEKWIASFIKNENPWNVTCPIWKKEAFEKIGGFDETFLYMEDPDLHIRALQHGLKFKTMYDLPADCFYRVHHFDETKTSFYYNSILYRIRFYQKLTSGLYSRHFIQKHKNDIKKGVSNLVRTFLYSRKNQLPEMFQELMLWMKESELFSATELRRYRFLLNAGNTGNFFLRSMRIKGLCYRLLPR